MLQICNEAESNHYRGPFGILKNVSRVIRRRYRRRAHCDAFHTQPRRGKIFSNCLFDDNILANFSSSYKVK